MKIAQRTRIRLSTVSLMMIMSLSVGKSQYLGSSRSTGLAAATVYSNDVSSLDWNAAALARVRDWEVSFTSYYSPAADTKTLTLQSISIGTQVTANNTAAFKFSPGSSLDFVVPSTFLLRDSTQSLEFDKKISYSEQFAAGDAFHPGNNVSIGLSFHGFLEKVTDTKYSTDTNSVIHSNVVDYSGSKLTFDVGAWWAVNDVWSVAAVARNIFNFSEALDKSVGDYELHTPFVAGAGVGFQGIVKTLLAIEADSKPPFHVFVQDSTLMHLRRLPRRRLPSALAEQ